MKLFSAVILAVLASLVNTATLDTNSLESLGVFVRRELLKRILWRLNETTEQQNVESDICQAKVKNSFSSCKTCFNNMCSQPTSNGNHPNSNSIVDQLLPLIFKPQLVVGSFIDIIGAGLPSAVKLLGSGSKLFLDKLGGLANEIGHTFSGLTSVFQTLSSEFDKLGKDLITNAGNLFHQFESGANNLLSSAGKGAGSLLTQVKEGAQNLLNELQPATNALSNLGHTIGDGLNNLGNTAKNIFNSIFGKRQTATHVKRCSLVCPACDAIDLQKHSKEDVLLSVCGELYVTQQKSTLQYLGSLKQLYNATLSASILKEVIYNPSSVSTQNGVSFSKWNFTFVNSGLSDTFKIASSLKVTDLEATAKKIADKIWDVTQN